MSDKPTHLFDSSDQLEEASKALGMEKEYEQFIKDLRRVLPDKQRLTAYDRKTKIIGLLSVASTVMGAAFGGAKTFKAAKERGWSQTLNVSSAIGGGVASGLAASIIPGAIVGISDKVTGKKGASEISQEIYHDMTPQEHEAFTIVISAYEEKLNARAQEKGINITAAKHTAPPNESRADAVKQSQMMASTSRTV